MLCFVLDGKISDSELKLWKQLTDRAEARDQHPARGERGQCFESEYTLNANVF